MANEIRALIVDDEPLARRGVRQLLAAHPDVVVAAECRDGREALRALATEQIDLVFLDVQMPGLDGLDVIRLHGAARMPLTVFVTAHDAFAVRAFEAQALDYLVKPLSEARFGAAMERVRERLRLADAVALAGRLTSLLGDLPAATRPAAPPRIAGSDGARLAVPIAGGERLLDPHEIDWIEADDNYAIVSAGGVRYRVRESLTAFEVSLDPAEFARVHRRVIVRLDRVRELTGSTARLRDGTEVPVSRRQVAGLRALLRGSSRQS